jgi:putative transposase
MLGGVSTRRHRCAAESVGEEFGAEERATSKASVSRAFIIRTPRDPGRADARRLNDLRLALLMLEGIELKERTHVVATAAERPLDCLHIRGSRRRGG